MKSQDFHAFTPQAVPPGTKPMSVVTIRKDLAQPWVREELFFRVHSEAVQAAVYLQKKYPRARVNLNGGAYVQIEGRLFQVRQQALNGKFMVFSGSEISTEIQQATEAN